MVRYWAGVWTIVLLGMALAAFAEEAPVQLEGLASFSGDTGTWFEAANAKLDPADPKKLIGVDGTGVFINGPDGKTKHLISTVEHGDVQVHVEFMVPEGSNSGVYLQGRYEIQVFDSYGVEHPEHSDCGGIYQRYIEGEGKGYEGRPPLVNASKKPGHWQSFDITFRAPRFDANGNKTAPAAFIMVLHNGKVVHEYEELSGPTRAAAFLNDEKPMGPLMLQGDHGPVAYRNITIVPIDLSHTIKK